MRSTPSATCQAGDQPADHIGDQHDPDHALMSLMKSSLFPLWLAKIRNSTRMPRAKAGAAPGADQRGQRGAAGATPTCPCLRDRRRGRDRVRGGAVTRAPSLPGGTGRVLLCRDSAGAGVTGSRAVFGKRPL